MGKYIVQKSDEYVECLNSYQSIGNTITDDVYSETMSTGCLIKSHTL